MLANLKFLLMLKTTLTFSEKNLAPSGWEVKSSRQEAFVHHIKVLQRKQPLDIYSEELNGDEPMTCCMRDGDLGKLVV